MKAKFVFEALNEITKTENEWANLQIDNYLSTKEDFPISDYIKKVIDYI